MIQFITPIFSWRKYLQRFLVAIGVIFFACGIVTTPAYATGVYDIPNLTVSDRTWIVDQADVISLTTKNHISKSLENLAKKTGNEVRIVTIRRLDYGETPESFTKALFAKWFPTPAAQANQTILFIDTLTNGTAIYSGEQVKSLLSDEIAQSITQETVRFPLSEDDKYNQAFLDASDRLVAVLSGQPDPGPPKIVENIQAERTFKTAEETNEDKGNATIWVIGLLLAATIIPMVTYYFYQGFSS